jgi:hypothetical protein
MRRQPDYDRPPSPKASCESTVSCTYTLRQSDPGRDRRRSMRRRPDCTIGRHCPRRLAVRVHGVMYLYLAIDVARLASVACQFDRAPLTQLAPTKFGRTPGFRRRTPPTHVAPTGFGPAPGTPRRTGAKRPPPRQPAFPRKTSLSRGVPWAPLEPRHRVNGCSTHAGSCRTIICRPRRSPRASRNSYCRRRCTSRRCLCPRTSPTLAETADAPCADSPTTIGHPRRRRRASRRCLVPILCASPTLAETADAQCADGPTAQSAAIALGALPCGSTVSCTYTSP